MADPNALSSFQQSIQSQITPNTVLGTAALLGAGLGAYHGYRRTGSLGWAVAWSLLGGAFPIVTVPVALAQGFGERK